MDFLLPAEIMEERKRFEDFLRERLAPHVAGWYRERMVPRSFFQELGKEGWLAFDQGKEGPVEQPVLKQSVLMEELARISPGVAVAVLVQISLGTKGLTLFGSEAQKKAHLESAILGNTLICLGNTEPTAGSDVANISLNAEKVDGGWVLNGTKGYVTNGNISDIAIITAVTGPRAERSRRMSMFLVDLSSKGISRKKLNKQVWIPSDLTRLQFKDVFVPDENLLGEHGRGLQQVLEIFTNSRVTISALALGTAVGAFELGVDHARKREVFGRKIADYQAKSFEIADFYSRIEAARLVLWKTCWNKDRGGDFRLDSSMAKYLTVEIAREVGMWAADLFGAASVIFEHPIHKFPMDAWAASLGEGTQDIQKLIIFREVMKRLS
ncbi:acyl-CoA dehydrogenase family protein [Desulforhabdus amnigena]|uniref:Acyl-CoA dehydrogenase n=1 Tax=Desulforhabdus amnigena TaxID=40218 RepID=A0A9W6L8D7_9BACT|nr:acyl-CoA dehydrogenase family protein [Desulforhabdus amnigena]NLJ28017.1 acyl-CoA/acyl-ACP dehydrogenase [Deltaproteobacteria bacterium]GLI35547.1 acyl-CoA dehydrogenase [Desulforhabdus amnigena]